jgi:hypothetical protein
LQLANGGVFAAFDLRQDAATSLYQAFAANSLPCPAPDQPAGSRSSFAGLDANVTSVLTQTDMDHVVAAAIERWAVTG